MKNLFFSVFIFCIKFTSKIEDNDNSYRGEQNSALLLSSDQELIQDVEQLKRQHLIREGVRSHDIGPTWDIFVSEGGSSLYKGDKWNMLLSPCQVEEPDWVPAHRISAVDRFNEAHIGRCHWKWDHHHSNVGVSPHKLSWNIGSGYWWYFTRVEQSSLQALLYTPTLNVQAVGQTWE